MTSIPTDYDAARAALTRLLPVAMSDTGQARRVADFLMAWWNGPDLGHFQIADMFGLDLTIAADITTVIGFLGQNDRGAIYIDSLGFAEEMQDIIALWRKPAGSTGPDGSFDTEDDQERPDGAEGRASERR